MSETALSDSLPKQKYYPTLFHCCKSTNPLSLITECSCTKHTQTCYCKPCSFITSFKYNLFCNLKLANESQQAAHYDTTRNSRIDEEEGDRNILWRVTMPFIRFWIKEVRAIIAKLRSLCKAVNLWQNNKNLFKSTATNHPGCHMRARRTKPSLWLLALMGEWLDKKTLLPSVCFGTSLKTQLFIWRGLS